MIQNETYQLEGLTVNKSTDIECWRLVHDHTYIYAYFFSTGYTETIYELKCSENKEELDQFINDNNLIPI